ncbi:MAG: response regulator transcription factor [Chloroflexi bacterium]|nr:response regulator transcription factor [Chloroflexota bacterium]
MDSLTPIRVLIADDHTIVRQGLHALLQAQPDIQVVGEAGDGAEAVRLAHEAHPSIAIMDIAMPVMDGLVATRVIKRDVPEVHVLILTMHENDEYFFRALQAGASGYVLKQAAATDLIAAIRAVARGEVFLYPSIAKKLLLDYLRRAQTGESLSTPEQLTLREHEVLALIAEGLSNREIAERLVLSRSTVQTHYSHILQKLGLQNRVELIRYALRHGLIDQD